MTAPKPPPRTLQPAEERKIQLFLERAAPIVLENPKLTSERWEMLATLATELDLTADQFRSTIDDLLNRGVIKRMEVTPPKPPPLPGHRGTNSSLGGAGPAEDFSLSPPVQLPGPPPPPGRALHDETHRVSPVREQQPDEIASPPQLLNYEDVVSPRDQFLGRAAAILAEQRGWSPKSQALINAAAKELGLNEIEAKEALDGLRVAGGTSNHEANKEKLNFTRWRVEGAPAPVPPPPTKTPAETFLDFARPSLAAVRDGVVSEELEQRLMAHATRVLRLSAVYARHLLLDLVAERRMRLASQPDTPPPITSIEGSAAADPRLEEFLHVATPILAQHRGMNNQSRILLATLARERGLSEQEMERAISTVNAKERAETMSRSQQERLGAFRTYVEAQLKKGARGILAPALYDKLANAGVELYGVENEVVATTIREMAGKLHLAVVTHEEAERHLTNLLSDVLPQGAELTRAQRERIDLEGAQWGLSSQRVGTLIDEYRKQLAIKARSEERWSRLALTGAVSAVVLVCLFLLWVAISRSKRHEPVSPLTSAPTVPTTTPIAEEESSWLESHSELSISVLNARSDYPTLRKPFVDLAANDSARRTSAYETVVDYFLVQAIDETRRRELAELLSLCVALDPATDSAEKLITSLLREIPTTEKPELDSAKIPRMYWGVRAVSGALSRAAGREERITQIVSALHRVIGLTLDPKVPAAEQEQICLQSLSEKLFRVLVAAAAAPLPNASTIHTALAIEATKYLDAAKLHRFNANFLAAVLTTDGSRWHEFEDLLRQTTGCRDTLAILELVKVYENTMDSQLRDFLGQLLLIATPGTPPGNSVEEIATFVRQGLGVRDVDDPDGIWTKLVRDARNALASAKAPPEPPSAILTETLRLAHYSTLACAFAQNEWSNAAITELRKTGPKTPESIPAGRTEESPLERSESPTRTLDRATMEALRQAISGITNRRSQPTERIAAIEVLTRGVERIPDLPPEQAATLATYVLGNKSSTEHARVLEHIPDLCKWNQFIVAMADRVDESMLNHEQLKALVSKITGTDTALPEGKEGKVVARRELMQFVMHRVAPSPEATKPTAGPAENSASILSDCYALQAQLFAIPIPDSVGKARDPQATLRVLIDEFQSRLTSAKLSASHQTELARVPHEITTAEFLAANDVQQLVFLERLWLRLLALEAVKRNPDRAAEVDKQIKELHTQDRKATHILTQLRDGHAAILKMWLLIGK